MLTGGPPLLLPKGWLLLLPLRDEGNTAWHSPAEKVATSGLLGYGDVIHTQSQRK